MIEGLWVLIFGTPNDQEMDLNGGVVVIETGRILGGDSGYFYVGSIEPIQRDLWQVEVCVTRHDPRMESVFGDIDEIRLSGKMQRQNHDHLRRPVVTLQLEHQETGMITMAVMTKVSNLP